MSDLFRFFDQMNKENYDYVNSMSDEEVKGIAPYVLLCWAQGATQNNEIHVLMTDLYCNQMVFSLSHHPKLLLKLFMAANGNIDNTRYKFVKPPKKGSDKATKAIAAYYKITYTNAKDYVRLLSEDEIERIISIQSSRE